MRKPKIKPEPDKRTNAETAAIKEKANKWFLQFAEKNIGEGKKYRYVRDFCKAIDYHEYNFNGLKSGVRKVPIETIIYTCQVHGIPYEKVFGNPLKCS